MCVCIYVLICIIHICIYIYIIYIYIYNLYDTWGVTSATTQYLQTSFVRRILQGTIIYRILCTIEKFDVI